MGRRLRDPDAKMRTIDLAVARRLRELRKERQAQLDDIAAFVGISPGQFAKYESCANRISANVLFNAAIYLNVPVKDLFALVDPQVERNSAHVDRLDELMRHFVSIQDEVLQRGLLELSRFLRVAGREEVEADRLLEQAHSANVGPNARPAEATNITILRVPSR